MTQGIQYADITIPIRSHETRRVESGFVPVCFSRLPDEVLSGLPLYMRNQDDAGAETFTLYAAAGVKFTPEQRERLQNMGITFVHIPASEEPRLRQQLDERLESLAVDAAIELPVRCEIVYEHAVELLDESLKLKDLSFAMPRLSRLARSVVKLYQTSQNAFELFFTASRHDASASTHAANVATWIPALAKAMGETSADVLTSLSLGGMLYDVGMGFIAASILNQGRKLNASEKLQIQQHAEAGAQMIRQMPRLDPVAALMAMQHHERLDGSGYPRKLMLEDIHPAARMASVLDTFEALTSFRPFRKQGLSPAEAMNILKSETPNHYDPKVVEDWIGLFRKAFPKLLPEKTTAADADKGSAGRRRFERFVTNFPAILKILTLEAGQWVEQAAVKAVAHNLSRGGLGILLRMPLMVGQYFKAQLQFKNGTARHLTGVVVRVSQRPDGIFEAGARFVDLAQESGQHVDQTPPA